MSATQTAPVDAAEQFLDRTTPIQRMQHMLHKYPALGPAIVLVVAIIAFTLMNSRFISPSNLSLITQQVAVVGTLAIGQTIIILTAGIDLSVGAIMVLSSLVMAKLATAAGLPGFLALLIGFATGALAGFLNGFLVTKVKLPPFIATLGTLSIFTALALLYSGGTTIRGSAMPGLLTWTGEPIKIGGFVITWGVLIMLVLYVFFGFILARTAWGRHVYAVGDDKEAARLAGISVNRVLLSVYIAAGLVFAITAWILIGRIDAASPNAGADANLDSITAVVIGGTSLFGGRGTVYGTLLGALIVGVFRNGLSLAGYDVLYQTLVVGILVILAVAVDQWIRKVRV
ncbi:MAG: ABC transporter permease [Actinobacteria bacterium]|nr:MAG: ABC transporter permease [Actinomycetota bacterium]